MAFSALRANLLLAGLLLILLATPAAACFGPKLFIAVGPGVMEEMRYHLVAIYLHEKTGIESEKIALKSELSAIDAFAAEEIDLGFSAQKTTIATQVLQLDNNLFLYAGPRPLHDLQFSTVGRALARLQKKLTGESLDPVRQAIKEGRLPASAVRDFMLEKGWI